MLRIAIHAPNPKPLMIFPTLRVGMLALLSATWVAPVSARAAAFVNENPAPLLTAEDAVATALRQNFSLALTREETDQARLDRKGGVSPFLPSAAATASRSGELDGSPGARTTLGVSANVSLFDGLRSTFAYRRLKAQEAAAEIRERAAVESTVEAVLSAYYDVALQQEQLTALREALSVSEERAQLAEARRSVGAGSRLEALQALADRNADSSALMSQELTLRVSRVALNALLARDPETAFSVSDSIPVETAPPVATWRAALSDRNAAIAAARASRHAATIAVDEARGAHLPTLAGSVGYSESPASLNAPTSTAPGATTYGLNLTVPLFDGFRTNHGTESARIAERRGQIAVRQAEQDALAQFAEAADRQSAGLRQIDLETRNLEVARLQAEAARERYRAGAASPLEFRDAQQRLLASRGRLASVRQATLKATLALRRLSGTLASPSGTLTSSSAPSPSAVETSP